MELREKFILPEGTTQVMASFRYRGRRSRPSSRGASPNRSTSSQSCMVHPAATTAAATTMTKVSGSSCLPAQQSAVSSHRFTLILSPTVQLCTLWLRPFIFLVIFLSCQFVNPCLFCCFCLPFYHDLPLFLRINTLPEIMISPGLQTANPPPLLNHQTPSGAKVHRQRYRPLQNKMWDGSDLGPKWNSMTKIMYNMGNSLDWNCIVSHRFTVNGRNNKIIQ